MSNTIDFKRGHDTGEADPASIAPIKNGEPGTQATFNRPLEVLRNRTEVLRISANEQEWVLDSDRGAHITLEGGTLTWNGPPNGRAELAAPASLVVSSWVNPGTTRGNTWQEGNGTRFPSRLAYTVVDDGGVPAHHAIRFVSKKYQYEGGNTLRIEVRGVPASGAVTVNVVGTSTVLDPSTQPGLRKITVTYDPTLGTTIAAVLIAINADPVASSLVTATYIETDLVGFPDTDPMYDVAPAPLSGSLDGVFHQISSGVLSAFFNAHSDNALREGDTLAIWYETLADRRQSIEETGKHLLQVGNLVNLSREPDKAAGCLPVARVVAGELVFQTGLSLPANLPVSNLLPLPRLNHAGGAWQVGVQDENWAMIAPATNVQIALSNTDMNLTMLRSDLGSANARVDYYDASMRTFTSMRSAIDYLEPGESGFVYDAEREPKYNRTFAAVPGLTTEQTYVCTDGEGVYVLGLVGSEVGTRSVYSDTLQTHPFSPSGRSPVLPVWHGNQPFSVYPGIVTGGGVYAHVEFGQLFLTQRDGTQTTVTFPLSSDPMHGGSPGATGFITSVALLGENVIATANYSRTHQSDADCIGVREYTPDGQVLREATYLSLAGGNGAVQSVCVGREYVFVTFQRNATVPDPEGAAVAIFPKTGGVSQGHWQPRAIVHLGLPSTTFVLSTVCDNDRLYVGCVSTNDGPHVVSYRLDGFDEISGVNHITLVKDQHHAVVGTQFASVYMALDHKYLYVNAYNFDESKFAVTIYDKATLQIIKTFSKVRNTTNGYEMRGLAVDGKHLYIALSGANTPLVRINMHTERQSVRRLSATDPKRGITSSMLSVE